MRPDYADTMDSTRSEMMAGLIPLINKIQAAFAVGGARPLTPEGWAARVLREGQEAQGLGRASAERLPPFVEE